MWNMCDLGLMRHACDILFTMKDDDDIDDETNLLGPSEDHYEMQESDIHNAPINPATGKEYHYIGEPITSDT